MPRQALPARFALAASGHPVPAEATGEVAGRLLEALGDRPGLLVVLANPAIGGALEDVAGALRALLHPEALLGAVAAPLWAQLGSGRVDHAVLVALAGPRPPLALAALAGPPSGPPEQLAPPGTAALLALADDRTTSVPQLAGQLHALAPAAHVVVAGLARGTTATPVRLLLDDHLLGVGAVALALPSGALVPDPTGPAAAGLWFPPPAGPLARAPLGLPPDLPLLAAPGRTLARSPSTGTPRTDRLVLLGHPAAWGDSGPGAPLPWSP